MESDIYFELAIIVALYILKYVLNAEKNYNN